jgi:hypothetical protein
MLTLRASAGTAYSWIHTPYHQTYEVDRVGFQSPGETPTASR